MKYCVLKIPRNPLIAIFSHSKDARNSHLRQDFFAELNGCETLRRKPQSWDPSVVSPEISGIQVDRVIVKSWETTTEFEHPKKHIVFFLFAGGFKKPLLLTTVYPTWALGPPHHKCMPKKVVTSTAERKNTLRKSSSLEKVPGFGAIIPIFFGFLES